MPTGKAFRFSSVPALDVRKSAITKASAEQLAAAKERARKRRISLFGPFSGANPAPWVGKVLGKHKLRIITGGRMGPVDEIVKEAIGHGAKNISVIVEPWAKGFNPNIPGKARNITARGNDRMGTRPLQERLGILQTHKIKGYLFLYPGAKTFSGTMLELQAIVNAHTLEGITSKQWSRPIILIGKEWKPVFEQIKSDYASKWNSLKDNLIIVENEEQLDRALQ